MKQCPACKTTYTDDSLRYCLADGSALDSVADEQPTVARKGVNGPLRVDIGASTPHGKDETRREDRASSGMWLKIVLAIVVIGILSVAALGLIGAIYYYGTGGVEKEPTPTPTQTPVSTPTPDAEKEKLRDELANIQKRLDEQKKPPSDKPSPNPDLTTTVTANSPADGFLALRSQPDSETGKRIFKIPHGAKLQIGACGDYVTTRKNNYGRWCRAAYAGYSGWVFDKYVIY